MTTALDDPAASGAGWLPQTLADALPLPAGVLALHDGALTAEWLNAAARALGLRTPALGLPGAAREAWVVACLASRESAAAARLATAGPGGGSLNVLIAPLAEDRTRFSFVVEPCAASDAQTERLRQFVDVSRVGIILYDGDGVLTYANDEAVAMIGRPVADLLGTSYRDAAWRASLGGRPLPAKTHPYLAALTGAEGKLDRYIHCLRPDGHAYTALESTLTLRDAAGQFIGAGVVLTDVSEFEQQQDELRASKRRYERLVNAAREGIFELAADGRLLAANPAFTRLFGFDDVGAFIANANEEREASEMRLALLAALAQDGDITDREVAITTRQGTPLCVLLSARAVRNADGELASVEGTVLDISARKSWEQGLREQNEYLEALHQTALGLMEGHDPAAVMDAILRRAAEFVACAHGYVYVLDPDGAEEMVVGAALGAFEQMRARRVAPGEPHIGEVWQSGAPRLIDDEAGNWEGTAPWLPPEQFSSVATVPLIAGERVVGVLGVARELGAPWLRPEELAVLERFAPLAALALDNAALYRRLGDRLSRTQAQTQLNQLISASLDTRDVFSEISSAAARLMDVPFASFWLVDEAKRTVALRACSDSTLGSSYPNPERSLDDDGHIAWIVRERRTCAVPGGTAGQTIAPGSWHAAHNLHYFYGFPVMRGETVLGVLGLSGRRPLHIGPDEQELLENLAAQAAVAIHNAGLYEQLGAANAQLMGWVAELERRSEQIHLLSEMGELLQSCLTADEAYAVLGDTLGHIFPDAACALYVLNASRTYAEALVNLADGAAGTPVFRPDECWALRRGRLHVIADARTALRCRHVGTENTPYICVPMMAQGEAAGVLHVRFNAGSGTETSALEATQRLAQTVAEHTALALANLKLRETLRNQAIRDQLTGLYNRRYMEESLTREIHRSTRAGTGLGVLMLDLDHFKRFNDTHGHAAGDVLLREICAFLGEHVRGEDIACRYGGEELTLILPDVTLDEARARADDLRRGVRELVVRHRGEPLSGVTVSIGVAIMPQHGASGDSLLQAADDALYRAKALGRDRVVVVGE